MSLAHELSPSPVLVRAMRDDERPRVVGQWLRSYEPLMPAWETLLPKREWIAKTIAHAMRVGRVTVATLDAEPDVMLGWLCSSERACHYVYVLAGARRQTLCGHLAAYSNLRRGTRMTARPTGFFRSKANEWGWIWRPWTEREIEQ